MEELFDEFGIVLSPAAQLGVGAAPLGLPDAPAAPPAAAAPLNAANAQQPARARAPSKCSLCLAAGVTDTTHTKARCPRNPSAVNALVVDGSALPGALDHRALEGHFVAALAPVLAEPIFNAALEPPPVAHGDDSDSSGSSDTDAPLAASGDESASSDDGDNHAFLPFTNAVWQPHVMTAQVPLENPFYPALRSQQVAADMHGPEPPPIVPMFGGEVPPFSRTNEKGAPRNIPRGCKTAWQFINLLFLQEDWEKLCTFTNLAACNMPRHQGKRRLQHWKPVSTAEMKLFFAISSFLGVVKIQSRKEAWSRTSIFGQPFYMGACR
jgi:hypothetical protein